MMIGEEGRRVSRKGDASGGVDNAKTEQREGLQKVSLLDAFDECLSIDWMSQLSISSERGL